MRFIHVGVGGFGGAWVNVLKQEPQAEVVALVDINPDATAAVCEKHGYDESICFPNLEEALRTVETDAVVVASPPPGCIVNLWLPPCMPVCM